MRATPPYRPLTGRLLARGAALRALLLALLGASAAQGQQARPGLQVKVSDAETHEPLARAHAVLLDGRGGLTDNAGSVLIGGVGEGTWVVEVTHLGHAARRVMARVPTSGAVVVEVALAPAPIALAGVATRGVTTRNRLLLGFYTRAQAGSGQYFTRADIERINPSQVSDLFRMVPGMVLVSTSLGDRPQMAGGQVGSAKTDAGVSSLAGGGPQAGAGECPILYFLDGTPVAAAQGVIAAEVDVREVEGVEVYRRVALAPPQFRRTGDYCGVIVIWKREKIVGRGVRDASARPAAAPAPAAGH
jgi:hypothetical protein